MKELLTIIFAASCIIGLQLLYRYYHMRRLRHWMELGMAHYKERRFNEALRAFDKCVRINPQWLYARTLVSMCQAQLGRKEEALKGIEFVRALQPRQGDTWALISAFYAHSMPEARQELHDALEQFAAYEPAGASQFVEQDFIRRRLETDFYTKIKNRLLEKPGSIASDQDG